MSINELERDLPIDGLSQENLGSLLNTRTFEQYCEMYRWNAGEHCGFCKVDTSLNKVLYENARWRGWKNPFPQKHHYLHFIIAHKRHITDLSDLGWILDGFLLFRIIRKVQLDFRPPGGGVLMRFGDPDLNAGSIRHLHVNIHVPDGTGPVRPPLAKTQGERMSKLPVVVVWEKLRLMIAKEGTSPKDKERVCLMRQTHLSKSDQQILTDYENKK